MNRSIRNILSFFVGLTALTISFSAISASKFRPETLKNHYDVQLSESDHATVYLESDHTFVLVPSFINKDYVHICWGNWSYNEKFEILEIKNGEMCEVMNGSYQVEKSNYGLVLKDSGKVLVFKYLVKPHRYSKKSN